MKESEALHKVQDLFPNTPIFGMGSKEKPGEDTECRILCRGRKGGENITISRGKSWDEVYENAKKVNPSTLPIFKEMME